MAIEVTAVLAGVTSPQMVQVEVTGLALGEAVRVEGVSGPHVWTVRGGDTTATSSQLIRRDNLAPVNAAITYRAVVDGVEYESDPVTVPYAQDYVLTGLDGVVRIDLLWVGNGDPIEMHTRGHLSYPNGRLNPVLRYAPGGGESGTWEFATLTPAGTRVLRDMVRTGRPMIMRTSGSLVDFPPARIVTIMNPSRAQFGSSEGRIWSAPWVEVDDPLAGTPVTAWTLGDFSAVWASLTDGEYTWDEIDDFIVSLGGTFEDIDRFPWDEEAASL